MARTVAIFALTFFTLSFAAAQISAVTQAADQITSTSARLNGTTNADGFPATVRFLYGTLSDSYSDSVTADQSPILTDNISTPVTATISGLSPGTTYYVRVRTTDIPDGGVAFVTGSELSFTTLPGVAAISPSQNALNAGVTTTIQVTFGQAMLPGSFNDTTSFIVSGKTMGRYRGTIVLSGGNTVATFTPDNAFAGGELIVARLTENLLTAGSEAIVPFVSSFKTASVASSAAFSARTDYAAASGPASVFMHDLDRDGYADLVVACSGGNVISVYMNDGTGSFTPSVNYSEGFFTDNAVVDDLNGDGFGDIVNTRYNNDKVTVRLNNGGGTFADTTNYATGDGPSSVVLYDVNGDGSVDIVTSNEGGSTVSILLNNGDGTFAPYADYAVGGGPDRVVVSDIDNDGDGDVVTVNSDTDNMSILLNNGDGTFAQTTDYTTEDSPRSLDVSDVDGDGFGDVVVGHTGSVSVSVFLNQGNGTFVARVNYDIGAAWSLVTGDTDGDGDEDIVAAIASLSKISNLFNDGDGSFGLVNEHGTGSFPYFVALGDLDNDGDADAAVINVSGNTMTVRLNKPAPPTVWTLPTTNIAFGNATLNGTANGGGASSTVRFLIGTSSGSYTDSLVADESPVSGSGNTIVSAGLTGLISQTTYFVRVSIVNVNAYVRGGEVSFVALVPDSVSGTAVQLDGVNDFVTTGTTLGTMVGGASGSVKSILVWIKPTGSSPVAGNVYNGQGIVSDNAGYWGIYRATVGGLDQIWVYNWHSGVQTTGMSYTPDEWTHVALVHYFGTMYVYKNGVLASSVATGATDNTGGTIHFGQGYGTPFAGEIDEVSMWGLNLSGEQIRARMHETIHSQQSGLTAYWQFNEGEGTTTSSAVGGFAGTLVNTSTGVWESSTISVGKGSSGNDGSFAAGTFALDMVQLTMTESFDNALDLTGTRIAIQPNTLPVGYDGVVGDKMFILSASGDPGAFVADLQLNFGAGLLDANVESQPDGIRLFTRNGTSDGAWTEIGGAVIATPSTGLVQWSGVTSLGQFVAVYDESVLPVQMTGLVAEVEEGTVRLRWTTVTEVDNSGWEIQRRSIGSQSTVESIEIEAKIWERIGFVEGAGTSTSPQTYTFTDNSECRIQNSELSYVLYRLKQIDRSGSFSYSDEIRVDLIAFAPRIFHLSQNYPNPFNPSTTISYTLEADGPVTLKVYDLMGREVATLVNEEQKGGVFHEVQFDASSLSSGLYFARLSSGEKRMLRKLVLLK